jgi:hypothetical protein
MRRRSWSSRASSRGRKPWIRAAALANEPPSGDFAAVVDMNGGLLSASERAPDLDAIAGVG